MAIRQTAWDGWVVFASEVRTRGGEFKCITGHVPTLAIEAAGCYGRHCEVSDNSAKQGELSEGVSGAGRLRERRDILRVGHWVNGMRRETLWGVGKLHQARGVEKRGQRSWPPKRKEKYANRQSWPLSQRNETGDTLKCRRANSTKPRGVEQRGQRGWPPKWKWSFALLVSETRREKCERKLWPKGRKSLTERERREAREEV